MSKFILPLLLFTSLFAKAQIIATIIDSETNKPVPYVNIWIEGDDRGTTADENGWFSLTEQDHTKKIFINALGYTAAYVTISEIEDVIKLVPEPIEYYKSFRKA